MKGKVEEEEEEDDGGAGTRITWVWFRRSRLKNARGLCQDCPACWVKSGAWMSNLVAFGIGVKKIVKSCVSVT